MEIDIKGLMAAMQAAGQAAGKRAEEKKPKVTAAPLLSGLADKDAKSASDVDEEAKTKQLRAPAPAGPLKTVVDPKTEAPAKPEAAAEAESSAPDTEALEADEAGASVVGGEGDVVVSDTPAALDMEAVRSMLEEMVAEKLAELTETLDVVRTGVFGNRGWKEVDKVIEGRPLLDAFDSALADRVTFEDLGVGFDEEGNMVALVDEEGNPVQSGLLNLINASHAAAVPAPANVDLSGIESSLGEVTARVSEIEKLGPRVAKLENDMYLIIADGSTLIELGVFERDGEGNLVMGDDGKPKVISSAFGEILEHVATVDDLDQFVQRGELGPNGELAQKMVRITHEVMANEFVKLLLRDPLTQNDLMEVVREAAKEPETARIVLRSLASDVKLVEEVIARVEGTSMEDLQKPQYATHLEQVKARAPPIRGNCEGLIDQIPWDQLAKDWAEQTITDG
ncbi:MAG: hypothetical protein AB1295_00550 [Candidatus Micrarchaeota archaeon]